MQADKPIAAFLYDFDKTLCTKDMQEYKFIPDVGMEASDFWRESNALSEKAGMDGILAYMYVMLKRANAVDKSIRREDFVALGRDLEFFPGVEGWFNRMNALGKSLGLTVEHYIISSGLKEIIEGSSIYGHFREVYACEYLYNASGVACWPKNAVNYTTKTQFLFRVNKGILDLSNDVDLNKYTPEDERRVPFRNMVYIGDGLTDVPCMRLVRANGGYSVAVHKPDDAGKVAGLLRDGRVDFFAAADYTEGGALDCLAARMLRKIAAADDLKRETLGQRATLTEGRMTAML